MEDFVNSHISSNGNTSTALTYRRVFSAFLGEAVRDRIILTNPVLATKPPRNTNYTGPTDREPMLLDDLKRLLRFAADINEVFTVTHPSTQFVNSQLPGIVRENTRNYRKKPPYNIGYSYLFKCYWFLIALAAKTGLRPGELRALRWSNIHDGILEVTNAEGLDYNGRTEIQDPKSAKGKRNIKLDDETIEYLTNWKAIQERYKEMVGEIYKNDSDLIFTNWSGKPVLWSNFLRRYFRPILQHLNIPDNIVFYGIRHLNLSVLLQATGDPEMVARRGGHTDTHLVFNRYGHELPHAQDAAVKATANIINISAINEGEDNE